MSMEIGWLAGKKTKKKIERTKSNRIIKDIFEEYLKKKGKLCEPHHLIVVKERNQDGAFYISSTLDMRNITLEGTVVADSLDEAYVRRQRFLKIFTPKMRGTLLYRGRQIACVVEEAGFTVSTRQRIPNFFASRLAFFLSHAVCFFAILGDMILGSFLPPPFLEEFSDVLELET